MSTFPRMNCSLYVCARFLSHAMPSTAWHQQRRVQSGLFEIAPYAPSTQRKSLPSVDEVRRLQQGDFIQGRYLSAEGIKRQPTRCCAAHISRCCVPDQMQGVPRGRHPRTYNLRRILRRMHGAHCVGGCAVRQWPAPGQVPRLLRPLNLYDAHQRQVRQLDCSKTSTRTAASLPSSRCTPQPNPQPVHRHPGEFLSVRYGRKYFPRWAATLGCASSSEIDSSTGDNPITYHKENLCNIKL